MKIKNKKIKYVIGVDEAGRGPLAGPVSVGAFCVDVNELSELKNNMWFSGVRDSKKLSEKNRNIWLNKVRQLSKNKNVYFSHSFSCSSSIDRLGISPSVRKAVKNSIKKILRMIEKKTNIIQNPKNYYILLDGSLSAPKEFINQKTIIRGDDKEKIISVASIVAKVKRDKLMTKLSKIYPNYGFEIHKGYGTALHYKKIKKFGLSDIHRRSFLKGFAKS
ncbi:ribonuclease HII [Candidatus Nomurabacteria bacterium]|nr:ribonuclease HII [Candidatus Nomurabacteria bacterium]